MPKLEFPELSLERQSEVLNTKPVEIVSFNGKITHTNSFDVNKKIYHIFDNNIYNIIMDLSKLEYINSTGVAMLIAIFYKVKENDGKIVIGGVHPFLENVFKLMDLPGRVTIYDTLEEAKKEF